MRYTTFDAPDSVGPLTIVAQSDSIVGLRFATHRHETWSIDETWTRDDNDELLSAARGQLADYFAGERTTFDLPLAPEGTAFQRRVWDELCRIPFGTTISYGELARRVGNPAASRAVGMANGRNPIALVIPCHRVIGANGTLTGFGGGVDVKRALLRHEADAELRMRKLNKGRQRDDFAIPHSDFCISATTAPPSPRRCG